MSPDEPIHSSSLEAIAGGLEGLSKCIAPLSDNDWTKAATRIWPDDGDADSGPQLKEAVVGAVSRLPEEREYAEYLLGIRGTGNLSTRRGAAAGSTSPSGSARKWRERYLFLRLAADLHRPSDPGHGDLNGYRFTELELDAEFAHDPNIVAVHFTMRLVATRDGVRVIYKWVERSSGVFQGMTCDSDSEGHSLLATVPVDPFEPRGDLVSIFYLGSTLRKGDELTLRATEHWDYGDEPPARRSQSITLYSAVDRLSLALTAPKEVVPEAACVEYSQMDRYSRATRLDEPPLARDSDEPVRQVVANPAVGTTYAIRYTTGRPGSATD